MLRFLDVRHLAVIDQLAIEFEPGLNIITGETGAGKSVLVEAIDLLTGARAHADLVRTGEDTATVQAIFEHGDGREVIIRREISSQGRSRAFLGDALASTAALRDTGRALIDLHGQHEHQALLDTAEHAALLDAFGGHADALASVGSSYDAWRTAAAALERTTLSTQEKRARLEMAQLYAHEIDRVAPQPHEDERLSAERTVLANADRLSRLSDEAYAALYEGEAAALAGLATAWKRVADLAEIDLTFAPYLQDRDDIKARLEDLAFALRRTRDLAEGPEGRLQVVEDRLAALERLTRKHGPTLEDVLARRAALADEIAALDADDDRVRTLHEAEARAAQAYQAAARELSASRQEAARRLSPALERALRDLAMPACRVHVVVDDGSPDRTRWTSTGADAVELEFSPNPGEDLRPLARIASGGELSRVMLALRALAWQGEEGRTLVFDEVDAGIGGAAADVVGARLQQLADRYQVICVTHLAQVAARGGVQFHISKRVESGRTVTTVARLDRDGREREIARMIAGAEVTPSVLASARELLAARGLGDEEKAKSSSTRPATDRLRGRRGA